MKGEIMGLTEEKIIEMLQNVKRIIESELKKDNDPTIDDLLNKIFEMGNVRTVREFYALGVIAFREIDEIRSKDAVGNLIKFVTNQHDHKSMSTGRRAD